MKAVLKKKFIVFQYLLHLLENKKDLKINQLSLQPGKLKKEDQVKPKVGENK